MYITNKTKIKDLPLGNFILKCENCESKKNYYLLDRKLAEATNFNTKYNFTYNKRKISCLKGLYKAYEIDVKRYKLYNI